VITGVQHPDELLVGRVYPATNGGSGSGVSYPADHAASQRESFTPLHRSILASSRWTLSDSDGKLVLVTLLTLKEKNGFVPASVPGIAHMAGVSVEAARKAIEALKSPDPYSRSRQNEGRTIEEVDGGFRFLNNAAYLERARARPSMDEREKPPTKIERTDAIQYNSATSQPQTTYEKPLNPTSQEALNGWHHDELAVLSALRGKGERGIFIIARGFAELAASKGETDFALATSHIAKELNITHQRASELRSSMVRKGVIKETKPFSREENKAARYRWALPTTIPCVPEPESDEDWGRPSQNGLERPKPSQNYPF